MALALAPSLRLLSSSAEEEGWAGERFSITFSSAVPVLSSDALITSLSALHFFFFSLELVDDVGIGALSSLESAAVKRQRRYVSPGPTVSIRCCRLAIALAKASFLGDVSPIAMIPDTKFATEVRDKESSMSSAKTGHGGTIRSRRCSVSGLSVLVLALTPSSPRAKASQRHPPETSRPSRTYRLIVEY